MVGGCDFLPDEYGFPVGVKLLCEARADPHAKNLFGDHALNLVNRADGATGVRTLGDLCHVRSADCSSVYYANLK